MRVTHKKLKIMEKSLDLKMPGVTELGREELKEVLMADILAPPLLV
jgi:hypothetical protein